MSAGTVPHGVVVLRGDDPGCAALEAQGYRLVAESWGARLRLGEPPELSRQEGILARAGATVREVTASDAQAVADLLAATAADFPQAPATPRPRPDLAAVREQLGAGRAFGAFDGGTLVAATVLERDGVYAETAWTAVRAGHRGRGLGAAVKAGAVVALAVDGVRTFGTGGASTNAASLAVNRTVGYVVEECWLTYRQP